MGKNAKKSKKNKAMKTEQAKLALAQEQAAASKPAEEEQAPAAAPAEEVKKTKEAPKKAAGKKAAKAAEPVKKKPGRKPMTAAEKAASAKARAEEKKKAESMTPTLTMQYGGRDVDVKALVQAAKDDFKANHKRTLLTRLELYLKPEESTLYYVANGSVEGKITF